MTTNSYRGPAKIYEFPVRGRFKGVVRPDESTSTANFTSPRVADVVSGSSWYHEAAVQEERARKD
jgi:uncharacterized protein DUF2735